MQRINEDIKNSNFKQIYLLYGEERYLKNQYTTRLRKALCQEGDEMNTHFYQGKDFSVFISGERENTEGIDNYQFQEIVTAFSQELDEITGFHAESVFVSYGEYETVNDEKNGMIRIFYD